MRRLILLLFLLLPACTLEPPDDVPLAPEPPPGDFPELLPIGEILASADLPPDGAENPDAEELAARAAALKAQAAALAQVPSG